MLGGSDKVEVKEYGRKVELPFADRIKILPSRLGIGDKIQMLSRFLKNYTYKGHNEYYSTTHDFVAVMDGMTKFLGYKPAMGYALVFDNVKTDHVLGIESIEKHVRFPTLDFYPYVKRLDKLAQIVLYDSTGLQHHHIPSDVMVLANNQNKDFGGEQFDQNILKSSQRVFLEEVLGVKDMKRVSELELAQKLAENIRKGLSKYQGSFEELAKKTSLSQLLF